MTNPKTEAISMMNAALIGGAIVGLIGGVIMGFAWGSDVGFLAGVLIGWAGSMWLLVGLIGYGVKLGREASPGASTPG